MPQCKPSQKNIEGEFGGGNLILQFRGVSDGANKRFVCEPYQSLKKLESTRRATGSNAKQNGTGGRSAKGTPTGRAIVTGFVADRGVGAMATPIDETDEIPMQGVYAERAMDELNTKHDQRFEMGKIV